MRPILWIHIALIAFLSLGSHALAAEDQPTTATMSLNSKKKRGFNWSNKDLSASETAMLRWHKDDLVRDAKLMRALDPSARDTSDYAFTYHGVCARIEKYTRSPFWDDKWNDEIGTFPAPSSAGIRAYRAAVAEMAAANRAEQERLEKIAREKQSVILQAEQLLATQKANELKEQETQARRIQAMIELDQARSLRAIERNSGRTAYSVERIEQRVVDGY